MTVVGKIFGSPRQLTKARARWSARRIRRTVWLACCRTILRRCEQDRRHVSSVPRSYTPCRGPADEGVTIRCRSTWEERKKEIKGKKDASPFRFSASQASVERIANVTPQLRACIASSGARCLLVVSSLLHGLKSCEELPHVCDVGQSSVTGDTYDFYHMPYPRLTYRYGTNLNSSGIINNPTTLIGNVVLSNDKSW